MARRNEIEILIKSRDEATPGIKVLGLSLTDLRSGIQLVAGTAQQAAQAMKAAFDFTAEGAAVLQTRDSFDRLGLSIESLRDASLNTVDDMTLMKASLTLTAGASQELQGHLLGNAPALLEIAKAANAVNPTLGDTAFMYESIATGIKRGSPLILDNLGLVVKVGEANERYAAQLGKSVEALTAEEKQVALLNATIEAGGRLIEQAGGSVESSTDAWAQLRVEVKNVTDEAKANAATIAGPVLGRYADFLKLTRENEESLIGLGAALRFVTYMLSGSEDMMRGASRAWMLLTGQYDEFYESVKAAIPEAETYTRKLEDITRASKDLTRETKSLTEAQIAERRILESMKNTLESSRVLTGSISEFQSKLARETMTSAEAWDMYSAAIARSEQASADYYAEANRVRDIARQQAIGEANVAAVHSDLTERLEEGSAALGDLYNQRADILRQIQELEASNGRAVTTQARANMTEAEATLVTLQLADAQAKLAAETDPMKAAQLAVKIEDLQGKLAGATTATTTFIDNSKRIAELQGEYAALGDEIDGVTGAIKETIDAFIIQQLEGRLAIDGWTEAENHLFLTLAQGLGVYDEQHAALAASIFQIADSVDGVGESADQAWANAIAGAAELLGMSDEVVAKYVDMAVAAGEAAGATENIARVSDGVHEAVSNMGKQGKAALEDIATEAQTEIEQLEAIGTAADTAYGQISSLGKDGAGDLTAIGTEAETGTGKLDELGTTATETQTLIATLSEESVTSIESIGKEADTTSGKLKELGSSGAQSLGDVISKADTTSERLRKIGVAADEAQARIDAMKGKDVEVNINFNYPSGGPPADSKWIPQAQGGDYFVTQPTPFIAGDDGPERAIFIPQGQPGYDAPSIAAALAAVSGGAGPSYNQSRTVNIYNPVFPGSQTASVRALSQMEF